MTKRNRLDDFHALQGVLGTKTLEIDVNHGSARRGLPLVGDSGWRKGSARNGLRPEYDPQHIPRPYYAIQSRHLEVISDLAYCVLGGGAAPNFAAL